MTKSPNKTELNVGEMPREIFLYKNGDHLESMEFTPAPTYRDWTLYVRADLVEKMKGACDDL